MYRIGRREIEQLARVVNRKALFRYRIGNECGGLGDGTRSSSGSNTARSRPAARTRSARPSRPLDDHQPGVRGILLEVNLRVQELLDDHGVRAHVFGDEGHPIA